MAKRLSKTIPSLGVVSSIALMGVLTANPVSASDDVRNDTIAACNEAARLLESSDVDAALEEAEWCREGIQQMKQQQTLAVFPDEVNGYTGAEVTSEGAMGMVMLGREYNQGDKSISVEITSGSLGGGLGQLSELISAFGSVDTGEGRKFRIQRRTVVDMSEGGSTELSVRLKSGGMMMVSSTSVSSEETVEFLQDFPLAELDDALAR